MNQYDQMYAKKTMTAEEAFNLLQDGDVMFSAQAAAEPVAILDKLPYLKQTKLKDLQINTCLPIQDFSFFFF